MQTPEEHHLGAPLPNDEVFASGAKRNRLALGAVLALALGGATFATAVALDSGPTPRTAPAAAQQLDEPAPEREQAEEPSAQDADSNEDADAPEAAGETSPEPEEADTEIAPAEPTTLNEPVVEDNVAASVVDCIDGEYIDDWEPSVDEIQSSVDEANEMAGVLNAAGVVHEIVTDEFGYAWVEFDWNDPVANVVASSFYESKYPMDYADEEWVVEGEELEHMRAENQLIIDALEAAGKTYELVTDDQHGYEWVEFDYDDPEATAVVDAVYMELYPEYAECEGAWEPSAEELAEYNQEAADLSAVLTEAGIEHTVVEDSYGSYVDFDYNDDAVHQIVEAFYAERYGYDLEDDFDEDFTAETATLDALAAALTEAGIDYERTGEPGCEHFVVDITNPEALAAIAAFNAAGLG